MDALTHIRFLKVFRFLKSTGRNLSGCVEKHLRNDELGNVGDTTQHIYKRQPNTLAIIEEIVGNVVHKSDDFVVTCKPYGVGVQRSNKILENYQPQTYSDIYMQDILPQIANIMNYPTLWVAKAPERFASGVMILASKQQGIERVRKSIRRTQGIIAPYSYFGVTVGLPSKKSCETILGLKILHEDNHKILTLVEKWSRNSVKKQKVIAFKWKHEVLSESELASLVKIDIKATHKNSLRLTMATKFFAPILGDQLFGNRINNLMGVFLPVNPRATSIPPQQLNSELLMKLELQSSDMKIIPSHVHLHSITLCFEPNIKTRFSVPLPESFKWTCKQLNLDFEKCKEISDSKTTVT